MSSFETLPGDTPPLLPVTASGDLAPAVATDGAPTEEGGSGHPVNFPIGNGDEKGWDMAFLEEFLGSGPGSG